MENITFETGKTISFRYKGGRKVKGIGLKSLTLQLLTDYIGKNEEWEVGQYKAFNIKEMKKLYVELK
jgi:hypothetical protein